MRIRSASGMRAALLAAMPFATCLLHAQVGPAAAHGSGVAAVDDSDAPDPLRTGWSASLATNFAHDSSSGWSVLETPSLGIRFNRRLSADASLPYYAYVNAVRTGKKGNTRLIGHQGALGDAPFAGHLTFEPGFLSYTATGAFSIPTGDPQLGLGTGHLGYNLNNHFERNFGLFTPDFEVGVGNTSSLVRRKVRKSYTSSGLLGFLQAGSSVDLPYQLALDLEGYEQLPLGTQTVYSRTARKKGTLLTRASDAEDNGFSVGLDAPAVHRLALGANYSHSIRLNDTTVGLSVALLLHAPAGR